VINARIAHAEPRLRQENRELRGQLELAAAVIQRITLENRQLRQEAEATGAVIRSW